MIPQDWKESQFRHVATIANGQINPKQEPYCNYLYIGPENIESGTGRAKNLQTAKELNLISGKYLFNETAIVYSKIRPNLNKICLPSFTGICSADMYPIWVDENILDRTYLFYFMTSDFFLKFATDASLRTGLPKINRQDLDAIKILYPPLIEQRKIAGILSTWDKAIALLEQLITAKCKLKQGLMQQLLTGKKRFKEFAGSKWREYYLGDLFNQRKENSCEHLPLLSITREQGIVPREEIERKDTSNTDKSQYLRIYPGDIGYNTMRMWQGVSALSSIEGIVSPAYTVLIPRKEADGNFFGFLFKYQPITFTFERYSQGLTSDTWNLKFNHFSQIKVTVPIIEEQQKIASILSTIDSEISNLEKQLTAYKQQKRGLMQQLLTGKKRVKIEEPMTLK